MSKSLRNVSAREFIKIRCREDLNFKEAAGATVYIGMLMAAE